MPQTPTRTPVEQNLDFPETAFGHCHGCLKFLSLTRKGVSKNKNDMYECPYCHFVNAQLYPAVTIDYGDFKCLGCEVCDSAANKSP